MNEMVKKLILLFESEDYKKLVFYLLLLPMFIVPSFTYILFFENSIFQDLEFAKLLMLILVTNSVFVFLLFLFGFAKENELLSPHRKGISENRKKLTKAKSTNDGHILGVVEIQSKIVKLREKIQEVETLINNHTDENDKIVFLEEIIHSNKECVLLEDEMDGLNKSIENTSEDIKNYLREVEILESKLKDFRADFTITSILLEAYIYISYIWIGGLLLPKVLTGSESGKTYILVAILVSLLFHLKSVLRVNKYLEKEYKIRFKGKISLFLLLFVLLLVRLNVLSTFSR